MLDCFQNKTILLLTVIKMLIGLFICFTFLEHRFKLPSAVLVYHSSNCLSDVKNKGRVAEQKLEK